MERWMLVVVWAVACGSDAPEKGESDGEGVGEESGEEGGDGTDEDVDIGPPENALARITFNYSVHPGPSSPDGCEMAYTGYATEVVDCPDCQWAFAFEMVPETLACPEMWMPEGTVRYGLSGEGPDGIELVRVYEAGDTYWYDDIEEWDGSYFRGLTWTGSDGTYSFTHWTSVEVYE